MYRRKSWWSTWFQKRASNFWIKRSWESV